MLPTRQSSLRDAHVGGAPRQRIDWTRPSDITFINLNLMLAGESDGTFDQQAYIPLGILSLASVLRDKGFNVELIDYQLYSRATEFNVEAFVAAIGATAPVVGLSCMSNLLPFAIELAECLRRAKPDIRIVLGGVGPSPVAHQIIAEFPFIDTVIEGEGEINLVNFMMGDTSPTPAARLVDNLDELPLPAYELIDFARYDASPSIITSRGCPYKCSFCTEPYNFGGRVRFRSIDHLVEELELVHSLSGRRMFLFQDDILPLKPSRFMTLLKGLRELSFPINWKCFSRVDLMNEYLMAEMARSGCVQIRYGIESGCNRTLDRIRKEFTIEQAFEVAARSVKFFPSVHTSFIWGYPFETVSDLEETLHWVERFEEAGCSVLLFEYSPLPGSPLYQHSNLPLKFSPDRYSIYVLTGHEKIDGHRYGISPEHRRIYEKVRNFPEIFSGFYEYEHMDAMEKLYLLRRFQESRRTRVRNEYDL